MIMAVTDNISDALWSPIPPPLPPRTSPAPRACDEHQSAGSVIMAS